MLNQPPFETLISFIISANNNVKRISRIVETLCLKYGKRIGDAYDFPTPGALSLCCCDDLVVCGTGYRAPYIAETAGRIKEGFDLDTLSRKPYLEARKKLIELPGVGPKVADCILLYSMGFTQAFPRGCLDEARFKQGVRVQG